MVYLWCKVNHKCYGVVTNDEREKEKERKKRKGGGGEGVGMGGGGSEVTNSLICVRLGEKGRENQVCVEGCQRRGGEGGYNYTGNGEEREMCIEREDTARGGTEGKKK